MSSTSTTKCSSQAPTSAAVVAFSSDFAGSVAIA
jgi:hypothetical protein